MVHTEEIIDKHYVSFDFTTKYKVYCKRFNKSSDEMLTECRIISLCRPEPFKASFCEIVYRPLDREKEGRTRWAAPSRRSRPFASF